jgi:Rrf2 family protein
MKISTKGHYGSRLLLDLALRQAKEPVPLKDIARRQEIPLPYLRHLANRLIAGGLLHSRRGFGGGVSLAKSPGEIRLSEVIRFLEGPIVVAKCINHPEKCDRSGCCALQDIWTEVEEAMNRTLKAKTLEDLVELQHKRNRPDAALKPAGTK